MDGGRAEQEEQGNDQDNTVWQCRRGARVQKRATHHRGDKSCNGDRSLFVLPLHSSSVYLSPPLEPIYLTQPRSLFLLFSPSYCLFTICCLCFGLLVSFVFLSVRTPLNERTVDSPHISFIIGKGETRGLDLSCSMLFPLPACPNPSHAEQY